MRRKKDRTLKDELPRLVGAQYATGDQWRYNSRRNEGIEPKQKQYPVVDGTGDRGKLQCCKEQYCIGTWNVRSINQCKLEVVKQQMIRVTIEDGCIVAAGLVTRCAVCGRYCAARRRVVTSRCGWPCGQRSGPPLVRRPQDL